MSVSAAIKTFLSKYPFVVNKKREIWHKYFEYTRLNLCDSFPLFQPNSAGFYPDRAALAFQTINQTFPALSSFAKSIGLRNVSVVDIETFSTKTEHFDSVNELKSHLDMYGSDKANSHNYHHVYGTILSDRNAITGLLEIGMGTNNPDVVSNMGAYGKPGASLRAFRDFLPNARVFGADIDSRILFSEDRIETFFVDQTDPSAFVELDKSIPSDLDLIIDDGLHSPNANIYTMQFALSKIKVGGWFVIEDIALQALPVWEVVAAMLPDRYESYIYRAASTLVFAVKRLN
ncbi:MAG: hypothetical protein PHW13_11965 [Methylococcales bacterium]|nr:hypothetical protein [Methylococcales bacterium]